jgi:hypothetical protein
MDEVIKKRQERKLVKRDNGREPKKLFFIIIQ